MDSIISALHIENLQCRQRSDKNCFRFA